MPSQSEGCNKLDTWNRKTRRQLEEADKHCVKPIEIQGDSSYTRDDTYRHDPFIFRAAVLVRIFPLTQRCRLRDISVRMNFGECESACTKASSTSMRAYVACNCKEQRLQTLSA